MVFVMSDYNFLSEVKDSLGITGNNLDNTLKQYINEVVSFLNDAGIDSKNITPGIISRGVSDLWNYGSGEGSLSDYFMMRATQLSLKG